MVTKGIITSIDFNGNTCQVRIPLFETAGNDPITGTAIVSNTPGSYNGYKVGDVVLVAFEDGKMQNPVIVGKLYLGAAKEKQDPRGTINVETTTASKSASLPADAVLTANVDSNVPNTNTPFGSLASIANNLNSLNTDVNQLDRFTRNQFNSVITDVNDQGEQLRSEIKQTASNIKAEVVNRHQDGSQEALGWDLNDTEWKINAQDTVNGKVKDINIVTIDRNGMSIAGDLKLSGYPKNTTIRYAQNNSDKKYPTPLYDFTKVEFPVPFPSGDEDKDKTWYYGKYIKITEADEEKYVLVFKENFEQYQITVGTTVAYSRNINPSWSTEAPGRADGKYIWQWTHTEIYSFDGDKWSEKDDDKIVCITGAKGEKGDQGDAGYNTATVLLYKRKTKTESVPTINWTNDLTYTFATHNLSSVPSGWSTTIPAPVANDGGLYVTVAIAYSNTGTDIIPSTEWTIPTLYVENGKDGIPGETGAPGVSIKENKQWYILKSKSFPEDGQKPESIKPIDNTEPTYVPAPTPTTLNEWMSTPPEAVNDYVVWTCYGSIFSDDTPENRHIKYSDPVKDAAYALAQGKTTNYYSNTDPSKVYSVKKGDCWFETISSTDDGYNNETSDKSQGKLYQCSGFDANGKAIWEDIGGELVANKLTANYINALDITAKKITVLDPDDNTKKLFEADGINGTGNVSIANFTVKNDKLYSGEHDEIGSTKAGIYLGSEGLSIGSNFKITTGVDGTDPKIAIVGYTKSVEKKYCIVGFAVVTATTNKPVWWDDWNDAHWSDTPPNREDGNYIWEWTKTTSTTNANTDTTKDTKVCITGAKGDPGKDGTNGLIPSIGQNGNWWIGENDTGIKAEGLDGHTPEVTIGENGNWYIDGKDTGVLAKGTPGEPGKTGRSVLSVTKYYKLATSKPNPPNAKDPTDWYTSPPAFVEGNKYYESDRTIYDSVDGAGNDYSWSDVIENSMLTVDFINSLGITAKKITVLQDNSKDSNDSNPILFQADGTSNNSGVKIGGFTVDSNRLYAGNPGTSNSIELASSHKLIAYKSNNQGVASSYAVSKITVNKDITNLTVYIRSYADPDYDYTMISKPNVSSYPIIYFSDYVKAHTRSKQNSSSALDGYTEVEYYGLKQNNWIYVVYVKDGGTDLGTDTGYLLIPETTDISIEAVNDTDYTFERDASLDTKEPGASLKVGSNFSVDSAGAIKSTSGTIGGFTIDSNRLYAGTPGKDNGIELASIGTNKASIKVGSNFSVDSTGAIKSTSGTIGNLSIVNDGLVYESSSTSFKIGRESSDSRMPKYAIYSSAQRIDDCIMGLKDNIYGETFWAEFKPEGYCTYGSSDSENAVMTGKISYEHLKHICWLNTHLGSAHTGSSATCPQIIVFDAGASSGSYQTYDLSANGINEIIGAQITEKRTAASSGTNGVSGHGFKVDGKTIYIYNGTAVDRTYSVLVIAI